MIVIAQTRDCVYFSNAIFFVIGRPAKGSHQYECFVLYNKNQPIPHVRSEIRPYPFIDSVGTQCLNVKK